MFTRATEIECDSSIMFDTHEYMYTYFVLRICSSVITEFGHVPTIYTRAAASDPNDLFSGTSLLGIRAVVGGTNRVLTMRVYTSRGLVNDGRVAQGSDLRNRRRRLAIIRFPFKRLPRAVWETNGFQVCIHLALYALTFTRFRERVVS